MTEVMGAQPVSRNRTSATPRNRGVAYLALLAMLASVLMVALATWMAPVAGAQVTELKTKVGAGYSELVEDNIDELCLGQESTGDEEEGEDAGCDATTEELWEAAVECVDADGAKVTAADDISSSDEKDFMACMAEEGFGEEEEKEESEAEELMASLTLGRVSASLTAFYVNELSPLAPSAENATDEDDEDAGAEAKPAVGLAAWAPILSHPGQAGGFVGALDRSKGESNEWLFGPGNSANTAEVKYSSFSRNIQAGGILGTGGGAGQAASATNTSGTVVPDAGVEAYLTYGALLSGLGLDSTTNREGAGMGNLLSASGMRGAALLVAYMGAGAVDTFFETILEALQFLNPFRFMVEAVAANTSDPGVTAGMAGERNDQDSAFQGLRDMFTQVYSALVSIGWMIVVPLLLVFLLLGMTMFRSAQTGSKAKKLVIIVAFLALGLPLLGTMYTASLSAMAGASVDSARANSTKVVLSTLVDFESWVSSSRLSPSESMNAQNFGWNSVDNTPTGQSEAMVRKFAEEINTRNNPAFNEMLQYGPADPRASVDNDLGWGSSVISNKADGTQGSANVGLGVGTFNATRDLLMRYATGANVTASGFESEVKAAFTRSMEADQTGQVASTIAGWFDELSDPARLSTMTAEDVASLSNPLIQVLDGGLTAIPPQQGNEEASWAYSSGNANCSLTGGRSTGNNGVLPDGWAGDPETGLIPCNMSPMSMYNYLNTSFGSTSMETFSPESTSSMYTRVNHAAVSSVGAGPAGILYFFSAMTVLSSFVIIGFLYAMGLMFSSIKRAFGLIGAALGSAVGLLSAIAKVVVLTAALFIELFATLFLYKLIQEFIVIIPTLLEKPLGERLSSAPGAGQGMQNTGTAQAFMNADPESQWGAAAATAGAAVSLTDSKSLGIVALMITLVTTVSLLIFTFMAVKLRRGLLDTIDQGVTNLVNKFTESNVEGGLAPGQPGAIRQGLSRGGSMAMTSMMMGGMGGMGGGGEEVVGGAAGDADGTGGQMGESSTGGGDDGAPGTGGSGAMTVGDKGQMLDAAGNPVPHPSDPAGGGPDGAGGGGRPASISDMVPIDSTSGHVMDSTGEAPVIGADGSPLEASDIAGFDNQGRMLDSKGEVISDQNGNDLRSTAASSAAARLMGDEQLANAAVQNGLSKPGQMISPLTGQPISSQAAAAGATGPIAPSVSMDPAAPKLPGQTPVSDSAASGRSLPETFAMGAAGGIASSVLSGQRKKSNMFGAGGGQGGQGGGGGRQGPIPKK